MSVAKLDPEVYWLSLKAAAADDAPGLGERYAAGRDTEANA